MLMATAFVHYPPAIVESAMVFVRQVAEGRRMMRRLRAPVFAAEPAQPLTPTVVHELHRPVDVAHWLPNMPRGHEDRVRGGVRAINADCAVGWVH